ncbi:MutS family protein MSH4 PWA37_000328 [Arxiozyma heterogenica]|uniref:MutS family protein MSH4 n=1 Tax=Arxiozyma heterogenica TaxID=278026 RepID=UPI002F18B351
MEPSNLSSFLNTKFFETDVLKENVEKTQYDNVKRKTKLYLDSIKEKFLQDTSSSKKTPAINKSLFIQKNALFIHKKSNTPQISRNITTSKWSNTIDTIIFAIFETPNTLSNKIGSCIVNFNTGELIFSEMIDTSIFIRILHKIQVYEPTFIVTPSSSSSPYYSKLITILKNNIPECTKMKHIPNKTFSSEKGFELIKEHTIEKEKFDSLYEEIHEKKYALAAVSGAMWFIMNNFDQKISNSTFAFRYFRIRFENPEDTMLIDSQTIRTLELVENKNEKTGLSLFSFLNSTCTPMGKRLLRNNILQPLTHQKNIMLRLESAFELAKKRDILTDTTKELKTFEDLDKLFSKLLFSNSVSGVVDQKINYILALKKTILSSKKIYLLFEADNTQSNLLKEIRNILSSETLLGITDLVNTYINEDCIWANNSYELQKQKCYAVKSGSNGLLKVSREVYRNILNEILEDIKMLSTKYHHNIAHGYETKRGFFLKIKKPVNSKIIDLPSIFINKSNKKSYIECSTINLLKANARLHEAFNEVLLISEQIIDDLFDKIKNKNISSLFMLAEAIAMLDMLCCFASNTIKYKYCKPVFADFLYVKKSRHPILENHISPFISNDILSIKGSSNFHIITGCNASGKSVYLKQIALLSIMAQIGCLIPATSGTLPIFKKLHARICNDSMEINKSNFAFEMKEIIYYLENISCDSLLIIDELCRGSDINQGLALALSIVEYMLNINSTVFLSTHFMELPNFFKTRISTIHLNMKTVIDQNKKLKKCYSLCSVISEIKNYGILSVCSVLNASIIEKAYKITNLLSSSQNSSHLLTDCAASDKGTLIKEMKKINNTISVIFSFLSANETISSDDIKDIQTKIIENM